MHHLDNGSLVPLRVEITSIFENCLRPLLCRMRLAPRTSILPVPFWWLIPVIREPLEGRISELYTPAFGGWLQGSQGASAQAGFARTGLPE
jgi:hypothetical protein